MNVWHAILSAFDSKTLAVLVGLVVITALAAGGEEPPTSPTAASPVSAEPTETAQPTPAAFSLITVEAISIGAVSADSGANLGCVDSNGNGFIDVSELFDVIDAYFGRTPVSADSESNLACVDSNGNGFIDVSELFDVIDAYFGRTPVFTPTPEPFTVLKRETEYSYSIELPDNWTKKAQGRYSSESPWAQLTISSHRLPEGTTVERFTEILLEGLGQDWWFTPSLFEITSVDDALVGDQPAKRIRYRVQEAPQYCVMDGQDIVVVADDLAGFPQGFRVKTWMCEHDAASYAPARESILESFQVTTRPAEYYTQYVPVKGIMVKAHESVDPAALRAGAEIVYGLLSGRKDIAECMPFEGADLAIIPRDQVSTDLPEFAHLAGTRDFTGRRRDTFEIRGLGGVRGNPVSAAGEEQLLGNWGPEHPWYPFRGWVAAHEYAHAVQNLCFTPGDHELWNDLYGQAQEANLYPGFHLMANEMEFFAVMSTVYFEVSNELGDVLTREDLAQRFPEIFEALERIYMGTILPEKYRTWTERQQ